MNDFFNENASPGEHIIYRFKSAWIAGVPHPIEEIVPATDDPNYLDLLERLICIEQDFTWKSTSEAPEVETYLHRFPRINQPEIVQRLIEHECLVRCQNGWRATVATYRQRFPDHLADADLWKRLQEIIEQDYCETGVFTQDETVQTHVRSKESRLGPFGNYELLEELGRGGMGIVYRAQQLRPERIVALKVVRHDRLASLPRETQASTLDRFRHESQAAAQLAHDNIATVYEVGQVEGEPFYSMQYVEGSDLNELLRDGPLDGRDAGAFLEQIARAVQAAHDHGVLHRDLKPQNILVDQETNRPLVVDFGLAKFAEANDELTCDGEVLGSPSYMSPEQVLDATSVTVQSDVYSLGATLYHAITGRPPFQSSSPIETIRQVIDSQAAAPHLLNRAVDRDLETICLKCIEKEPSRRYASAKEMADDLRSYLEGRPIVARPVGPVERVWRWCRRNPVVASLTGATCLAVVIALVASIVGYINTSAALAETRIAQQKSEQSHQHARSAVHRFFTLVSEDKLLNQPGMQPLQKELLDEALVYYQQFLKERGDDPDMRDELALTHFRVGWITEQIESPAQALSWYQNAAKMQQAQIAAHPGDQDRLEAWAKTQNALGRAQHQLGKYDLATLAYHKALKVRQDLFKSTPEEIEFARTLANTWMNLGNVAIKSKQLDTAQEHYQQAMQLREDILKRNADHIPTLQDTAKGHYNLGTLALIQEDISEAMVQFRKGHTTFQRLLTHDPKDLGNQYRLIVCCRLLADLHAEKEQWPQARDHYDEARKYAVALAENNPDVPEYQAALAGIYMNIGQMASDLKQPDQAHNWWQKAKTVLDLLVEKYPDVESYQQDRDVTAEQLKLTIPE